MTTSTSETTEPTFDDLLVTDAAETAAETAAHDQADAAAAHRAAEQHAKRVARENKQMTAAWISLALGLVISMGTFSSIAWQHSVAANGTTPAVSTTAP